MRVTVRPGNFGGTLFVPPCKSLAHRFLIAAALAGGRSKIDNIEQSNDIKATVGGLRELGADISFNDRTAYITGIKRFLPVMNIVNCGESGSTLRFFIPVFSLTGDKVVFKGEGRLMQRPQTVYSEIFRKRGLMFSQEGDFLTINGALTAGKYSVAGDVSSQFITGLLYALSMCDGDSVINILPPFESRSYVLLTVDVLQKFGVSVCFYDDLTIKVKGGQKYVPGSFCVEGDYSQAAFWLVAGSICGDVKVNNLLPGSKQGDRVIVDILRRCGAAQEFGDNFVSCKKASLMATEIDLSDCPDLGPVLMVLGLFCKGETVISNAGRLRMKESDRILSMQSELSKMGADIFSDRDTVFVRKSVLRDTYNLDSHNDHRVAMALAVASVCAGIEIDIDNAQAVDKSYPMFWNDLKSLGAEVVCYER